MGREPDKIRRPLPLKIAVAVFSIVFAGAIVTSYMEYKNHHRQAMESLHIQGASIVESLSASLERLLSKGDRAVAQRIVGNLCAVRMVRGIVVVNDAGEVLLAGRTKYIGRTIPEIVARGWENDGIVRAQEVVTGHAQMKQGVSVGFSRYWVGSTIDIGKSSSKGSKAKLLLSLSTSAIHREAGLDAIRFSVQMLIVAFITSLVCFLVLSSTVTKPVGRLVRAVKALENGESQHEPLESQTDEIGVLSRSFRQMAETLGNREQELKSSYSNLQETQEKLVNMEKLRALGEMASGVAHDFNNILTAILGRAQLMKRNAKDEKTLKNLDVIEKAATDGAAVVRRLQDFTRTRTDRNFERIDMNEIAEDVLSFTRPRWQNEAELKGVTYRITRSFGRVSPVMGDASELREVLTNMLVNSLDAMPEGGEIEIGTEPKANWVHVFLRDTGLGMSPEEKRRIFDPFFTTKGVRGTGLGMSVAYGIVGRHGGEILVASELGVGTTVTVRIPVASEEIATPKASCSDTAIPSNLKVLVVDDEENVQKVLGEMLVEAGCTVAEVSSGEEAISLLASQQFDMVFTDLGMSPMNGWDVAKKAKEISRNVVVCLMTGWGVEIENAGLKGRGIDFVLPKPFRLSEVSVLMEQAFREREESVAVAELPAGD
ncbi:MAG: hybrid sensor histidine kinase/response regulator [Candidatus Eisenbacteria bacterium]|nr:hybrid sensor histidine kinase/response regulator [Candidatus Eisenbacteria bacterium]